MTTGPICLRCIVCHVVRPSFNRHRRRCKNVLQNKIQKIEFAGALFCNWLPRHLLKIVQVMPLEDDETMSPSQRDFQQAMSDNLNGDALGSKILSFQKKPPVAPEGIPLSHFFRFGSGQHVEKNSIHSSARLNRVMRLSSCIVPRPVRESHFGGLTQQGGQHMYVPWFPGGGAVPSISP